MTKFDEIEARQKEIDRIIFGAAQKTSFSLEDLFQFFQLGKEVEKLQRELCKLDTSGAQWDYRLQLERERDRLRQALSSLSYQGLARQVKEKSPPNYEVTCGGKAME